MIKIIIVFNVYYLYLQLKIISFALQYLHWGTKQLVVIITWVKLANYESNIKWKSTTDFTTNLHNIHDLSKNYKNDIFVDSVDSLLWQIGCNNRWMCRRNEVRDLVFWFFQYLYVHFTVLRSNLIHTNLIQ